MPAPRVIFPYGVSGLPDGEVNVCSIVFARSHGITPNVIILNIAPQNFINTRIGDLYIEYETKTLLVPDCLVDASSVQYDTRNRITSLMLFDRRWRWSTPAVSGHVNRRNEVNRIMEPQGGATDPILDTKRTPQQIATILLDLMGETGYDVSRMPNDVFPEMQWEVTNAALQLEALCDLLSCRVVLTLDNRVEIWPADGGSSTPTPGPVIRAVKQVNPRERPEHIVIHSAPTLFQADLEMEAVGVDLDESIKPIANLSLWAAVNGNYRELFAPQLGWNWDESVANAEEFKKKADHACYKWYRVKFPVTLAGYLTSPITRVESMLLVDYITEETIEDGRYIHPDPVVYGEWFHETRNALVTNLSGAFNRSPPPGPNSWNNTDLNDCIIPFGFSVDGPKCIVRFGRPVYRLDSEGYCIPARLWARIGFRLRRDNGSWRRHQKTYTVKAGVSHIKDQTLHVRRDELLHGVYANYGVFLDDNDPAWVTNDALVETEMLNYVSAIEKQYITDLPTFIEYAGFFPAISLTGVARSLEIVMDCSGATPIVTTVGYGQDAPLKSSLTYRELQREWSISRLLSSPVFSMSEAIRVRDARRQVEDQR